MKEPQVDAVNDKIISILAHDLRNPFSSVLTLTELVTKRFDALSREEIRHQCELAHTGVKRGMELLDRLVSWGKAQTRKVESHPIVFILRGIAEIDLEFVAPMAEVKAIELRDTIDDGIAAYADPNVTSTVLRNLLTNAIKFTPDNGSVILSAAEDEDGLVAVSVTDTGIGIEPDEIDRLFDIETHGSEVGTAGERGDGLGLLLCKELVEMSGGTIQVESNPGKGSSFVFTLPKLKE